MSFVAVAIGGMNAMQQIQAGNNSAKAAGARASGLEFGAQQERESALQLAGVIRRAGQRQTGEARAQLAASGVKVDEGTALEVQDKIGHDSQADAFQALLEGGRRARGLEVDAAGARAGGRMARAAGNVNAITSILGGVNSGMRSQGWRTNGPGFSGTQKPAPIETRDAFGRG